MAKAKKPVVAKAKKSVATKITENTTKSTAINVIHNTVDSLTKDQCASIFEALIDLITSTVASHKEVRFREFGTFYTVEKEKHEARNPKTNEKITVPKHFVVRFTPGSNLKAKVR